MYLNKNPEKYFRDKMCLKKKGTFRCLLLYFFFLEAFFLAAFFLGAAFFFAAFLAMVFGF
jgi:hypothetical protein